MSFFTLAELTASFALLLPQAKAAELAQKWFDMFADSVDVQGRYIHLEEYDGAPEEVSLLANLEDWNAPKIIAEDESLLANFSEARADRYLLRRAGMSMGLVGLLSDEMNERRRIALRLTPQQSERSTLQLRRAVDAYQRRTKSVKP